MTRSSLTPGLIVVMLIAASPVILPACLSWRALTHAGVGAVTATFCAALVAAAGCWDVFVVGKVLIEESWRSGL